MLVTVCLCTDIQIDSLTDDQRAARDFATGQISKLNGATLVAGEQNGNTFTLRFLGEELPKTLSDVTVVKNNNNGFDIVKMVTSSTVGGLQDKSRVTTKRVFTKADGTFADALRVSGI